MGAKQRPCTLPRSLRRPGESTYDSTKTSWLRPFSGTPMTHDARLQISTEQALKCCHLRKASIVLGRGTRSFDYQQSRLGRRQQSRRPGLCTRLMSGTAVFGGSVARAFVRREVPPGWFRESGLKWWRRRESNPRPKLPTTESIHAFPGFVFVSWPELRTGEDAPATSLIGLVLGVQAEHRRPAYCATLRSGP